MSRDQDHRYWYRRGREQVYGIYYLAAGRTRHLLCAWEEARIVGLTPGRMGKAIYRSEADRSWSRRRLQRLYNEKLAELVRIEKESPDDKRTPPSILDAMSDWIAAAGGVKHAENIARHYKPLREHYSLLVGDHALWTLNSRGHRVYDLARFDALTKALAEYRLEPYKTADGEKRKRVTRRSQPPSVDYRNSRIITLKTFLNWCHARDLLDEPPKVRLLTRDRKVVTVLDDDAMARLFAAVDEKVSRHAGTRREREFRHHELYLVLATGSPLRRGEIHSRQVRDLDLDSGRVLVCSRPLGDGTNFRVKGHQERWCPLAAFAVDYLREHVGRFPGETWLFDNGAGRLAFAVGAITRFMGRYLHAIGEGGKGIRATHGFRAKAATELLRDGVPLQDVQAYLAHKDPATTLRYSAEPDAGTAKAAEILDKKWNPTVTKARRPPTVN